MAEVRHGVGATLSIVVLMVMLVGPKTNRGFDLQRDCFESQAAVAIAAHDAGRFSSDLHGDGRCGLMTFTLRTKQVPMGAPSAGVWYYYTYALRHPQRSGGGLGGQ